MNRRLRKYNATSGDGMKYEETPWPDNSKRKLIVPPIIKIKRPAMPIKSNPLKDYANYLLEVILS